MDLSEFHANPVTVPALSDDLFAPGGLLVSDPLALLTFCSADDALAHSVQLVHGGVQVAPSGAIQDPAGSAVGTGLPLVGGGGSGGIYKAFPHLDAIPSIQERSAIFNSADCPGCRVVHSYSPHLAGSPTDAEARRKALEDLANTYANAILAFNDRTTDPAIDWTVLNLTPVAAVRYAGSFKNSTYGHLDPSYSIPAVYLAASTLMAAGTSIPSLTLYYFASDVFTAAQSVETALAKTSQPVESGARSDSRPWLP